MSNHQKILDKDRVGLLAACVLCQAQGMFALRRLSPKKFGLKNLIWTL
jgi:hypothetical protein